MSKLSNTHGPLINMKYIDCGSENVSISIESIMHSTLEHRENGFEVSDYNIKGDGWTEFFDYESIVRRMGLFEKNIDSMDLKFKVASIIGKKIVEITEKEYHELSIMNTLNHYMKENIKNKSATDAYSKTIEHLLTHEDINNKMCNHSIDLESRMSNYLLECVNIYEKYKGPVSLNNIDRVIDFIMYHELATTVIHNNNGRLPYHSVFSSMVCDTAINDII